MGSPPPQYSVLMTACIAPKAGVREGLVRGDPKVRLEDYKRALHFWLTLDCPDISCIVFAENSGYPLADLEAEMMSFASRDRKLEFLSFDFPPTPAGLNYGYSELSLVVEALGRSKLLATTPRFIKATGRYLYPDVAALLKRLPKEFFVALDSKGLRPFGLRGTPLTTIAMGIFDRAYFLRELTHLHETMVPAPPWNRKQYVEQVLFDHFYPKRFEPGIVMRWPCNCEPVGIGSNGDRYTSLRKRVQQTIRAAARIVMPSVWI